MFVKLSHVGVAVRNIDEALSLFTKTLGLKPSPAGLMEFPELKFRSILLPIGDNFIELLEM